MITFNYSLPPPFFFSSLLQGLRGEGWVVWVCQHSSTFPDGERMFKHFGRGQHKDLNEALKIAMANSEKHKKICEEGEKVDEATLTNEALGDFF